MKATSENSRKVLACREQEAAAYRYLLHVALPAPEPKLELESSPASRLILTVILKNPSLANAQRSDPTAGKVEAWAQRSGFGEVIYANLFAYRSPYPAALNALAYEDAVGAQNDTVLAEAMAMGGLLVAGWGNPNGIDPARYHRRIAEVLALVRAARGDSALHIVGPLTRQHFPRHGLLWNRGLPLTLWEPP